MSTDTRWQVLRSAAAAATRAPSIFNTQPWRWQIGPGSLRLWADRERQLLVADPDGRMLTISCGAALHHARLALAASGFDTAVQRMPDLGDPDLLAVVTVSTAHQPTAADIELQVAIARRRTDRRAFRAEPVPATIRAELVQAARAQSAHAHLLTPDQIADLAVAAAQADAIHLTDPAYRRELITWTHRPEWSGDGVPFDTAVDNGTRAVPIRNFAPHLRRARPPGPYSDRGACFAIVFTDDDTPRAWLTAGEALSAMLLTATARGLASAPISDVTELAATREQLHRMLAGIGVPQIAVRIGHPPPGPPPPAPRRARDQVIYPWDLR